MFSSSSRQVLLALLLPAVVASQAPACSCSSGIIPIPVDVTIAADPANPLGLNSTDTKHLKRSFDVFGVLCQPVQDASAKRKAAPVQLLLHGNTYTTQYWDVTWGGFQNYSYVAHSCSRGIASFAYDNIGAGQTTKPANSSDCQIPAAASVASSLAQDLKSGRVGKLLTGTATPFSKVVGIGHSLGSATLNYAAIRDGARSPFAGLILTGHVHDPQFIIQSPVSALPASVVNPDRWGGLDAGYVTTPNITARELFYGPSLTSFSHSILQLDELTKDIGSRWISAQIKFTYTPAQFAGPVVQLVGSFDQAHCLDNAGVPCNAAVLQKTEAVYWPRSQNFTMVVLDGFGHDVNFSFGAAQAFAIMTQLFNKFVQ